MNFQSFDWIAGRWIAAVILCPTNMLDNNRLPFSFKKTKLPRFTDFNRTIIPFKLVGYEMLTLTRRLRDTRLVAM